MMLVVQGDESPGQRTHLTAFRTGLHEYAEARLDRSADRIVLIEPNSSWHEALRALWSDWPTVEVLTGTVRSSGRFYRAADDESTVLSPDPRFVRTHLPNASLREVEVPVLDLRVIAQGAALLSLDARTGPDCIDQPWEEIDAKAVVIDLPGFLSSKTREVRAPLAAAGYIRAGRPWGEAGRRTRWIRPRGVAERVGAMSQQAYVLLGSAVASGQRALPRGARGNAFRIRALARFHRRIMGTDVLDPNFGATHQVLDPDYVRSRVDTWLSNASQHPERVWTLSGAPERDPDEIAFECYKNYGVRPISFNYPGPAFPLHEERHELISPIIPGFPYSFTNSEEYMLSYGSAALAVTHRKAGWDCFRHVEILAAGSVPLMLDIEGLPPYSMVHYPRTAMAEVVRHMRNGEGIPDASVAERLREHFTRHLTSRAMADYLLRNTGLHEAQRILFVDSQHPRVSDYQSTLALIGLKQILGSRVEPMFPAHWIYVDYEASTLDLYGRGFGYTRTVDISARSAAEGATPMGDKLAGLDTHDYDAVIIGSISRNSEAACELLQVIPPERTVWLHTEDTPPLPEDVRWMKDSGAHLFVRAIDAHGR